MKVIIIVKKDNGIQIIRPNEEKFGDGDDKNGNPKRPYSACSPVVKAEEDGLKWFICDDSELPNRDNLDSRKQLYYDGEKICIDSGWDERLMPDQLIKSQEIAKINKELDQELAKESQDVVRLIKLQRDLDKCKSCKAGSHNHSLEWVDKALGNLDNRVSAGKSDKAKVRQQLTTIKKELENDIK